jgi:hypothetical protein
MICINNRFAVELSGGRHICCAIAAGMWAGQNAGGTGPSKEAKAERASYPPAFFPT